VKEQGRKGKDSRKERGIVDPKSPWGGKSAGEHSIVPYGGAEQPRGSKCGSPKKRVLQLTANSYGARTAGPLKDEINASNRSSGM